LNINVFDYIDEYLHSDLFFIETSLTSETASQLLTIMFSRLEKQSINSTALETVLFEAGNRSDLSVEIKKRLPSLLESFFNFLSSSGKYPPAKNWIVDLQLVTQKYLSKIKEDGTLKGETFRKNYTDVGRNDLCPCGSGKKFKKCCMGLMY